MAQAKKPGGISTAGTGGLGSTGGLDENRYEPESMWVYEVGAKTQWFDRRLLVNVAGYYQDFSEKQVSQNVLITEGPSAGLIRYPHHQRRRGAGAGFRTRQFVPGDRKKKKPVLHRRYNYLDAVYTNFKPSYRVGDPTSRARAIAPCSVRRRARRNASPICRARSWKRHPSISSISAHGGGRRSPPTSTGSSRARAGSRASGYTDYNNILELQSYWLADLRFGLTTGRWELTAYVTNLFNDDTLKSNASVLPDYNRSMITPDAAGVYSGTLVVLPEKRQIGLRANYRF